MSIILLIVNHQNLPLVKRAESCCIADRFFPAGGFTPLGGAGDSTISTADTFSNLRKWKDLFSRFKISINIGKKLWLHLCNVKFQRKQKSVQACAKTLINTQALQKINMMFYLLNVSIHGFLEAHDGSIIRMFKKMHYVYIVFSHKKLDNRFRLSDHICLLLELFPKPNGACKSSLFCQNCVNYIT